GGSPDPKRATVPLDITFHTQRVGDVRRTTTLSLVFIGEKDKGAWKIDWSPEAILPSLSPGRLVRMMRLNTTRGRILARDGSELATFVEDRKSTRLNSSHVAISYAVFCLKKKKKK